MRIVQRGNHVAGIGSFFRHPAAIIRPSSQGDPPVSGRGDDSMARVILALAFAGAVLAVAPAAAQNGSSATPPMAPPAPHDSTTGSVESAAPKIVPVPESKEVAPAENPPQVSTAPAKDKPPVESKAPESAPAENGGQSGATAESKPADNTDSRYTFTR